MSKKERIKSMSLLEVPNTKLKRFRNSFSFWDTSFEYSAQGILAVDTSPGSKLVLTALDVL